jgi:hypothetical protein
LENVSLPKIPVSPISNLLFDQYFFFLKTYLFVLLSSVLS